MVFNINGTFLILLFNICQKHTPYMAPQVLVNVNHSMRVMTEESFGPVIGIMKVNTRILTNCISLFIVISF